MQVGDRVRVNTSVIIYHHPKHRGQAVDIQNFEGTIDKIATEWKGRPVSANFPLVVKFDLDKLRAHMRSEELEIIST
jgi:Ferredoxin thioredoxin reductase variable alpha chain